MSVYARPYNILLVFVRLAEDLINEAQMHNLRHQNIVMLLAVTFEPNHYGVIFEYITYGGLDKFLQDYKVRFVTYIHRGGDNDTHYSPVVTITRPSSFSSLKIVNRSFRCASACL